MKKSIQTNLALLVAFLVAFWFYREHKNVQNAELRAHLNRELLRPLANAGLEVIQYKNARTKLWSNRPYTTESTIAELKGLSFVRGKRNAETPYLLDVNSETKVYTMGLKQERIESGWMLERDTLLVNDVIPERCYDKLLKQVLRPGLYLIEPRVDGPSTPIFFDARHVKLQEGDS